ncbi:pectate lyase [Catenovulum agarivorans]|uniref:pectate lyase n=1 Tax=Catenovulum agarivorans TaxID=1172192 RepID=UPI0002F2EC73|nr:pectate lyase [Catenovulum agarivorans]
MKCLLPILAVVFALAACSIDKSDQANSTIQPAISLAEFYDIIKHWRDQNPDKPEQLLEENDIVGIANNILLYQRNNGGWPTNKNILLKLSEDEKQNVLANKDALDSSLDNRNTYPQIRYLAHAYMITKDKGYKDAAIAGLNYILAAQYNNGGFAHSPPRKGQYYEHITFADEVMPGTLNLLRDIAKKSAPFTFFNEEIYQQSAAAWQKGHNLLLELQVEIDGKKTIWAGQYHKETLQPVGARSYELAGLLTWESVAVVEYLMAEPRPSQEVIQAVEAAVLWFKQHKIDNLRIKKVETEPVRFKYFTSTYDLFEVEDETAPPIWARFYDLQTQQPFMAGREGNKVYKLQEVGRDRRTGYTWYGYWPQQLISESYVNWQKNLPK